jgi:prolyl-tRNA editing enzyme YbaK/EbsC (Cys-tRNA(Pro) deacylase)
MPPAKLGTDALQRFMHAQGVRGEILQLQVPTPTVEAAAQAVNARPDQIIKSILFIVDSQPVLAIACGLSTIGRRAIADLIGVGKKRVKLASPAVVLEVSGFEVGAMPPFGHAQPLRTLIDRRVLDNREAYAGGGADNALVRLDPHEIQRVTGATILDLQD